MAVVDYKFYRHMGQNNKYYTANYVVSIRNFSHWTHILILYVFNYQYINYIV